MRYTGRASWPIVSWSVKHELSKLGLPGSIVLHEISRPPAPAPSATAPTPSSAAASAATSTSTSTPSTVAATSATAPQESKSADGTAPADFSDIQAQLLALQSQFRDFQTQSFADAQSGPDAQSGSDSGSDDPQVEMTQIADTITQLSTSLQSLFVSRTPTTSGSSGTLRTTTRSLSDTTLDAALKDAGNRYKKIKQLEQLVRTYRPEDFNAASVALQRQLWTMANKQVYNHIKGVLGYKHRSLILDVEKDDGLAAWDRLKTHHNNRTVSTRAKLHEDYTNMTFDTPTRCRNFTEYKQALKDKGNDFFESSGERIDPSLTHSKYLALPERYSEIKIRLTNLDEQALRKGEPQLSLEDIESLVCSWEERDYVQKHLKA
ncbi:MAG: hypothetical protein VXX04_05890, partial [Actinomycetota bacterium]|nr:hypothetical protein [Actinomycetota bacterium]